MNHDTQCRCDLDKSLTGIDLNAIARLCHHSSLQDLMQAKKALMDTIILYAGKFDIHELTSKPMNEAIDYYTRITALQDYGAMTEQEKMIVATGFFRTYETTLQILRVETLINLKTGRR